MSLSYSALELATNKAMDEKTIFFYQEYESSWNYELSYDNFTFYDFVSEEDFLNELEDFVKSKSEQKKNT